MQQCMIKRMKVKGSNNYKLPHMGEKRLERARGRSVSLKCELGLISEVENRLLNE